MTDAIFIPTSEDIDIETRESDLETIRAKLEAMHHGGLFTRSEDVYAQCLGAVNNALAGIEFDRLAERCERK